MSLNHFGMVLEGLLLLPLLHSCVRDVLIVAAWYGLNDLLDYGIGPLVARLFAVVDVWDALRSDHPYRERWWPEEKVLAHIRSSAGTHFDPQVVEVFFRVVGEGAERL